MDCIYCVLKLSYENKKKRWYKIQFLLFSITLIALIYTYYMEEGLHRKICANMFEQ